MSKAFTVDYISKYTIDRGYRLLSNSYSNKSDRLDFCCDKHGVFSTTFDVFKRSKYGCPQCAKENVTSNNSFTLEQAKQKVIELGYQPTFDSYVNSRTKIKVKCDKHGDFDITLNNLCSGKKCRKCSRESTQRKNLLNIVEVKKRVESKGCVPLFDQYEGHESTLTVSCHKHGEFDGKLQNFTTGHGCPKCANGKSTNQDEILNFVRGFFPQTEENCRSVISPLEIDIYVPEIKLGIEYCGLRWHSEQFKKDKNYHLNKMVLSNRAGVRLITIFEDEWLERKDQVKGFLLSVLSKNQHQIGARKTDLRLVEKKEAKDFLDLYHIQGAANHEVAFGLFHKHELLGLVTGNEHHRQGFSDLFVLNRLVFKGNTTVLGGASKLSKALINYAKSKGYSRIISWSDNRWSEGNVYEKMGYVLTEELGPDYSYVNRETRQSKQSNKKASLVKKGAVGNTEREMALSIGLYRIWDCGKKRWEFDL